MSEILNNFMENMIASVEGLVALSVTEVETGIAFETYSSDPNFDVSIASAYNLEVVKAKLNAIKALNLTEEIQEITITLSSQIHIISIAPSGAYFIYLAVDSNKANLGIVRGLLRKNKVEINSMF